MYTLGWEGEVLPYMAYITICKLNKDLALIVTLSVKASPHFLDLIYCLKVSCKKTL